MGFGVSGARAEARRLGDTRHGTLAEYRGSPLAPFLTPDTLEVGDTVSGVAVAPDASQTCVFAGYRLHGLADYRSALQTWFRAVRPGGHLVIAVPHAFLSERKLALPSPWDPGQRRLYTPASLLAEVEEALVPNSYRVRWLGDYDSGYDYALDRDVEPTGARDVLLALERIEVPAWGLVETPVIKAPAPDYAFTPAHTRVEFAERRPRRKVLILKLDHLGDFIMGLPALERARAAFADAEITLVVGSWNLGMATEQGLADRVLAFDVFPRNSSEEEVDVHAKAALFQGLVTEEFDLAMDLRTDPDTRFLLRHVAAAVKAGIGTRAQFPHLDIFLPIDFTRNEPETAREEKINHHAFSSRRELTRGEYRIGFDRADAATESALVWGPYYKLRPGRYIFEPFVEIDPAADGVLSFDVALDRKWVVHTTVSGSEPVRLSFSVERPNALFEFRIWAIEGLPAASFSFYGGRLLREGGASVLHQSEYLMLLIELIAMRMDRFGLLTATETVP